MLIDKMLPKGRVLPPPFSFIQFAGAFSLFFVTYAFLLPSLAEYFPVSKEIIGLLVFSFLFLLYCVLNRRTLFLYFKQPGFKLGAISWLFIFPIILLWSSIMEYLVERMTGIPRHEQVAVLALKEAPKESVLFWLFILYVVLIVPLMEEVLFRGFLQNWLRRYLPIPIAIVTTSLIFAFFHYSPIQGWSNITIVSSLFILSCVLGWLLHKSASLRAPIALHAVFNTMSVVFIFFKET